VNPWSFKDFEGRPIDVSPQFERATRTNPHLKVQQIGARWRSGNPTLATSGATFVYGKEWGSFNGALAVAAMASERVLFMTFDVRGRNPQVVAPATLREYGRLRTVTQLPNGSLLVCTDGVDGDGKVLLVKPGA